MTEPTMRPVDTAAVVPPAPGAARHLAGFAGAGLVLAVGGAVVLPPVIGGEPRVFDGVLIGWLLCWITWLTAGEAVRLGLGRGRPARVYVTGFVGGVVLGAAVGFAAAAADVAFVLPLPVGGLATVIGAAWLFILFRRRGRQRGA